MRRSNCVLALLATLGLMFSMFMFNAAPVVHADETIPTPTPTSTPTGTNGDGGGHTGG